MEGDNDCFGASAADGKNIGNYTMNQRWPVHLLERRVLKGSPREGRVATGASNYSPTD
jgi:hypothetical protein